MEITLISTLVLARLLNICTIFFKALPYLLCWSVCWSIKELERMISVLRARVETPPEIPFQKQIHITSAAYSKSRWKREPEQMCHPERHKACLHFQMPRLDRRAFKALPASHLGEKLLFWETSVRWQVQINQLWLMGFTQGLKAWIPHSIPIWRLEPYCTHVQFNVIFYQLSLLRLWHNAVSTDRRAETTGNKAI